MPTLIADDCSIFTHEGRERLRERIERLAARSWSDHWYSMEDAIQDTLLSLIDPEQDGRTPETVGQFVRCCFNRCWEAQRADRKRRKPMKDQHAHIQRHAEAQERAERLVDAALDLMTDTQAMYCLAIMQSDTLKDAASLLGVSERSVLATLARIRTTFDS